jgi:hypothetical protein
MGGPRTRQQKKLERKRKNREERRRAVLSGARPPPTRRGRPAMSETLKHFAQPLLDKLPPDAGAEAWSVVLHVALLAWNAAITGGELPEGVLSAGSQALTHVGIGEGAPLEVAAWMRNLIQRKRTHFAADRRLVLGVEVMDDGDRLRVVAVSGRPA